MCFSIFKYKLKIENHPFFSDFRFFSSLFVTENVILKIHFFQKISIFNFPFFISLVPIESRKMKIFELFILFQKVKFRIHSIFYRKTISQNTKNSRGFRGGTYPICPPQAVLSCFFFRSISRCSQAKVLFCQRKVQQNDQEKY